MEPNERKRLSGPSSPSDETSRPNGSHDVTLDSILRNKLENPKELFESTFSQYHLTATISNSQLSIRDLSLLLDVLNYQILNFGSNFSMMLALTELTMRLCGGRPSEEISDAKIRLTVSVSEILIKILGKESFSLYSGEFVLVPSKWKNLLSPYLMSKRTYSSRFQTWRPEKLIRIRAVPVDMIFERSRTGSKRYSGYTKGYGESHGNAHQSKTKPSMELDGDPKRPDKSERNLILRMTSEDHQKSNILRIKFKNLEEEND